MSADLKQACDAANARVEQWVNRSAGQHRRAMNAQIVKAAEVEYAQPLHGYVDLDQRNSDGSSPHGEALSIVEIALAGVVLGALTFVLAALAGFFWGK